MKAVALLSGGLDSTLAVKTIIDQGIEVVAVRFFTPFERKSQEEVFSSLARRFTDEIGAQLRLVTLGDEFLSMLQQPVYGYGKNLNPCIDCKILFLRHAKKIMAEVEASFLVTGEVLGQRPMSQHQQALETIEKDADLVGLLLRPLSARLLPPTLPEEKGWVDRRELHDFSGRGRARQIALAKKLGITEYPWPAGGCLLTESAFVGRIRDLIVQGTLDMDNAALLRLGRHFRITPDFKLVVGRNKSENAALEAMRKETDVYFSPATVPGPSGLGRGVMTNESKMHAAQIIARYTAEGDSVKVFVQQGTQQGKEELVIDGASDEYARKFIV